MASEFKIKYVYKPLSKMIFVFGVVEIEKNINFRIFSKSFRRKFNNLHLEVPENVSFFSKT
jgi:hypothetical protein